MAMAMAVIKRKNGSFEVSTSSTPLAQPLVRPYKVAPAVRISTLIIALVIFGLLAYVSSNGMSSPLSEQTQERPPTVDVGPGYGQQFDIDANVKLILEIEEKASIASPGLYRAVLLAKKQLCPNLGFWLRLEGDALDIVNMKESGDQWEGSFSFPIAGSYEMIGYWKGCNNQNSVKKITLAKVKVTGESTAFSETVSEASPTFYPTASWISSQKFKDIPEYVSYIWHDPSVSPESASIIKTKKSAVSKEGATLAKWGFYSFHKLSNYELVCWLGSQSAGDIKDIFLDERRTIAGGQRPFKFHLYSSTNFIHPAEDWEENEQSRFRKCKQILVSIDEIKTPLTQQEYANQVTTFLQHLLKAFPDETFPIWIFTVNESPLTPTNCLPPFFLPRTSDHPCNDALRYLFDSGKRVLPNRVHLMDNSAVSLPRLGEHLEDVKAVIALRIFALVGKTVQEWRESGQVGRIDGLHRGENIEPNFELVPYPDWQQ